MASDYKHLGGHERCRAMVSWAGFHRQPRVATDRNLVYLLETLTNNKAQTGVLTDSAHTMIIPKTSTSITCPAAQGCREGHGRGMPLLLGHGQQKLKGHAPSLFTSRNPEQGTVDWINLGMGPNHIPLVNTGEHANW